MTTRFQPRIARIDAIDVACVSMQCAQNTRKGQRNCHGLVNELTNHHHFTIANLILKEQR